MYENEHLAYKVVFSFRSTEKMSEESKQRRKAEHEDLLTVSILHVCVYTSNY